MSQASSTPLAKSVDAHARSAVQFWPVFAWLALQMLALLVAGLRVPFSARFIVPEEQMALYEMYCVQMIAAAMLFPFLFRNFSTTVVVVMATPLCVQLAGVLAAESKFGSMVCDCAYPTLWLVGLAIWAYVLRGEKARLYGVAVALLWVLGGATVAYLDAEFGGTGQAFEGSRHPALGPLVGGITLLEAGPRTGTVWAGLGIFLVLSILAGVWRWRWSGRGGTSKGLV
jgi:hypothetical protein